MEQTSSPSQQLRSSRTRFALFWMHLASEPFMALYTTLLGFILRKDLGATAFQLSVLVTLRPVIALFSFYWSSRLSRERHQVVNNLIVAWILARLPFVFFPIFHSIWYLIFASAIYELFNRAATPASMEILKVNLEKSSRERLFSLVYVLSFIEGIALGLFVGKLLNIGNQSWTFLFMASSLLSMSSIIFQKRIPLPQLPINKIPRRGFKNHLIEPWKDGFKLMREHKEFSRFQWGFMIGGFGLMLIAPAIFIYFAENLKLSHERLTLSRYIWMGLGISLSTILWRKAMGKYSVRSLTKAILLGFSLYPFFLFLAEKQDPFLNIAFFTYGLAQAGSHLLWHLSGTLFARGDESSSKYTAVNVLMLGIRGAIAPTLGGVFCTIYGAKIVLMMGSAICLTGFLFMCLRKSYKPSIEHNV